MQDNEGARILTEDTVHHSRSKHIDIAYHYVRELVAANVVSFQHVPTNTLSADLMTKALGRPAFERFSATMFGG